MAAVKAVADQVEGAGTIPPPRFLLISVDPERDTPERLAQYLRRFDPEFPGATGTREDLRALTAQLGALYGRDENSGGAKDYLVDHSGTVFLLDPEARLTAAFSPLQDPQAMAADFALIAVQSEI
jgi:protein SCO1/2